MRKRKKNKNTKFIVLVLIIGLFFISNSYAMLSDRLTIIGTGNAKYDPTKALAEHEIYEPIQETPNFSNCTYTYKNASNWQQADGTYIYQIDLSIINLDKDYNNESLEIGFEEKQGLAKEQSKENLGILQAKRVLISGNRVSALLTEENSKVKYGETINLSIYLTYENEHKEGITIENVTLNGNKLLEETEETKQENTDTKTETNLELKAETTSTESQKDNLKVETINKEETNNVSKIEDKVKDKGVDIKNDKESE